MKMENVNNQEMYVLVAPDGSWQAMTLAPGFAECAAVIKLLHTKGLSQSYHGLKMKGFKILPVLVTITQNGDEETGFQKAVAPFRN